MNYWHRLHQTVQQSLRADRIGTPVSVRATVVLTEDETGTAVLPGQLLTRLVGLAADWLAAQPLRLYAPRPHTHHQSLLVTYASGATALLSTAAVPGPPHIDLAVLGSRGAVYHREYPQPARDGALALTAANPTLAALVERALATNLPLDLTKEGLP